MSLPFFYESTLPSSENFALNEDSSRHISQVLRMKEGSLVNITNGHGQTITASIQSADKKKTRVKIIETRFISRHTPEVIVGISLIKNMNRFEWFIEKATEIGVARIVPLICKRTEKTHFRKERMISIMISAMLQSEQSWLPGLDEILPFEKATQELIYPQRFIAHCLPDEKNELKNMVDTDASKVILIGPEGDFTPEEIQVAMDHHFLPVSLGDTRLRTETAAIAAAVWMK